MKFGTPRIDELRVESDNKQYGIYLQDDWDVNDRLQLNLGVRYDYEETPSYLDYVTPQLVIRCVELAESEPCAPAEPAVCGRARARWHRHQRLHQHG